MNRSEPFLGIGEGEKLAILGGKPLRTEKFGPRWDFGEAEKAQLIEVIERAPQAWRSGFKVREFCGKLQKVYEVRYAIATSSGTGAVHAALGALDPEPGSEVVTTPATDIGTIIGILQHNLVPVFVDWDAGTFNTAPGLIADAVTERTCAILVVHLFGNPCDMDAVMAVAQQAGVPVIEDCAQAHLARWNGKLVGKYGAIGCYSLGLKTLTTDQGGFVATDDADLAARIRGFLSKGSVKEGEDWVPFARLGAFYAMTDLQAAVGVAQLGKLENATVAREKTAAILDDLFAGLRGFRIPKRFPGARVVHSVYPFHIDELEAGVSLAGFLDALKAEGIIDGFGPYLKGKGLHRHPIFKKARTYGKSGYPLRDELGVTRYDYNALALPNIDTLLPCLGFLHLRNTFVERDVLDIAAAIRKVALHYRRTRDAGIFSQPEESAQPEDRTPPQSVSYPSGRLGSEAPPSGEELPRNCALAAVEELPISVEVSSGVSREAVLVPDLSRSGKREDSIRNDTALAEVMRRLEDRGGVIRLPQGTFYISHTLNLHRKRNIFLRGAGGNYINPGTRLIYIGSEGLGAIHLCTAIHCIISGICFVVDEPRSQTVIRIDALREGANAVSSLNNRFENCTFCAGQSTNSILQGLLLRDAAHTEFRHCWFQSMPVAVKIGEPIENPAPTISNGHCNNTIFYQCVFFGDVLGERGSNVTFDNCEFAALPNGDGAKIDFGCGKHAQVLNVTIRDCFAINGKTGAGTFFTQGNGGAGLVMMNNRVRGYAAALNLNGAGAALLAANVFETGPSGGGEVILLNSNANSVHLAGNQFGTVVIKGGDKAEISRQT